MKTPVAEIWLDDGSNITIRCIIVDEDGKTLFRLVEDRIERLPEELVQSKQVIEERIGRPVTLLSYPVGGFTSQVQSAVQQAGYVAACTTNRASPRPGIDPYALRRIKVTERDGNPVLFWAKLSGYYDVFRRLREPA